MLRDAEGIGLLPPRRAHAPAAELREDLPDGVSARSGRLDGCRPRNDPRQQDEGVLYPSAALPRVRLARRQSGRQPARRGHHGVGMGRLSGPRSARTGRGRQGQLVDAHGAEYAARDGQEHGELRELRAGEDGGDRRRLLRRHRARRGGPRQRRQRPERLHRARQHHLYAVARIVDPRRHHARLASSRSRAASALR